jgi:hypothetical protein
MLFQIEREAEGFVSDRTQLLSWPGDNDKLGKGATPSYGLTIQHVTTRIRKRLTVNACPHAGDCIKVCVLDNGNGGFPAVQRARRAKTRFLVNQPAAFAYLLGYELAAAVERHLAIHWRPNVNSDIRWEELIPSAFDGSALGNHAVAYDYTKDADRVLHTDGWLAPAYRVAYSWNENSNQHRVENFGQRGGSIAVVTSRKKGGPVDERIFAGQFPVIDADKTDAWMFESGVIGDLSAKGRARRLIGKSGFVVTTGAA